MTIRFGYGTNGFANHRLEDALAIIAELGYTGVALTLDHHHLDPFADQIESACDKLRRRLDQLGLAVVVETGARYLLDPRRKHTPTLLHDDPAPRLAFLTRSIDIAVLLRAEAVSFWSGVRPEHVSADEAWSRLRAGCARVAEHAESRNVRLGFEPEPGMFVETVAQWVQLNTAIPAIQLTLDIGHCLVTETEPIEQIVQQTKDHLVNVQIDDMRSSVHEHLEFGAGEVDFPPVLAALEEHYDGLVSVELPRHSHAAPDIAARSLGFLRTNAWLGEAIGRLKRDPREIGALFAIAARKGGPHARARLLHEAHPDGDALNDLYRFGDTDEKRAILETCPSPQMLEDALRTNDTRLITAALGAHAERLSDEMWRQGVLKSVFMGLPLNKVHALEQRADEELGRMLDGLRREREAAGRAMPADALALLERLL